MRAKLNRLLRRYDRWRRRNSDVYQRRAQKLETIDVQRGAFVSVCVKERPLGRAISASLYVRNQEALRFDCFGEQGHYHSMLSKKTGRRDDSDSRIEFEEKTVEQQIERTLFIISTRSAILLKEHPDPRIQTFPLNMKRIGRVAERLRARMFALYR